MTLIAKVKLYREEAGPKRSELEEKVRARGETIDAHFIAT